MNNWILARGREAEHTLADVVTAGARTIALPGAATFFAPLQRLFISEADGRETEWLGRVTQATASALAFTRPPHASKNSGARVWRAAAALEFPPEQAIPERRATQSGVATERTPDGTFCAVQTAQPLTGLRLRFEDLAASAEDELIAWLAVQTRWGLEPFALVTPEGAVATVRLADGEALTQERDAKGRRRLTLALTLAEEGAYP